MQAKNEELVANLVSSLAEHEANVTYLSFPKLAQEPSYLHRKLRWLCEDYNVSQRAFIQAHNRVSRPELVHSYGHPV